MSNNKMLIDATHPEETRVVVLRNGRVEEFDYESAARKLLRGNIYLAKVTRVEPALQAAFVDYGGNRHGFLAFNEIHPDYYQIPMADRQALLDEEAAAEAEEEAAADARAERLARRNAGRSRSESNQQRHAPREDAGSDAEYSEADAEHPTTLAEAVATSADDVLSEPVAAEAEAGARLETAEITEVEEELEPESIGGFEPLLAGEEGEQAEATETLDAGEAAPATSETRESVSATAERQPVAAAPAEAEAIEQVGSEDALEELPSRPRRRPRSYKIQEVIKRRQIILVQVVKEERGNKGAALTTYLSLAGRYTVLMPNTARGGGISRKITQPQDRKRLKAIAAELEVPEGMGLIIRTAGAARTKQEIKRDFEYLLRLWESVRDLTLNSQAPSLVYEEGNLIKRSIRDLYNKDVEEIVVAGEEAHRDAKDFMRMLMPSHVKHVIEHKDPEPVFARYRIEQQLNAMFSPYVTLRSGGYLVINQTEALVAVDVNSGKSTREFSIEETALNTNLEAADEIARQVKLRDLAGLIVIDFIDMEEKRNNRAVERRLKDALRFDRARIQLGHISHFGLMEMSRQRLRTGVLEGSTSQCPHCQGTGIIRSTESIALAVLRGLEDALMAGARTSLIATTTATVALYILNQKRAFIADMEHRYGLTITVQASEKLAGANFTIEKGAAPVQPVRRTERNVVNMDWGFDGDAEGGADGDGEADADADAGDETEIVSRGRDDSEQPRGDSELGQDGGRRRRRRRRRGRRGDRQNGEGYQAEFSGGDGDGEEASFAPETADAGAGDQPVVMDDEAGDDREFAAGETEGEGAANQDDGRSRRGRRRGRRGGRRGRERTATPEGGSAVADEAQNGERYEGPYQNGDASSHGDDMVHVGVHGGEDRHVVDEPVAPRQEASKPAPERAPRAPREPAAPRESARAARAPAPEPHRDEAPASASNGSAQSEPAPAEARGEAAAVEAPQPARRSRGQPTAGELKIERVVVRADSIGTETASSDETTATASDQPARKGWWQRRFGGE